MGGKPYSATPVDEHIGRRVQLRRTMMGLSQKDLAAICGVTFQQIQKYECAGNRISASRLFELSVALETPVAFFFAGLPGNVQPETRSGRPARLGDPATERDPLTRNESLELIRQDWKLPTDEQRELVMRMVKSLNNNNN